MIDNQRNALQQKTINHWLISFSKRAAFRGAQGGRTLQLICINVLKVTNLFSRSTTINFFYYFFQCFFFFLLLNEWRANDHRPDIFRIRKKNLYVGWTFHFKCYANDIFFKYRSNWSFIPNWLMFLEMLYLLLLLSLICFLCHLFVFQYGFSISMLILAHKIWHIFHFFKWLPFNKKNNDQKKNIFKGAILECIFNVVFVAQINLSLSHHHRLIIIVVVV